MNGSAGKLLDQVPDYDSGTCEHDQGSWLHKNLEPVVHGSGIMGIILTVIVLSRKTMCTSTNCYLTAMAVADLVILLILSLHILIDQVTDCQVKLEDFITAFVHVSTIFAQIALFASVWLTVMLAVERYIAICHPLQAMTICTTTRARVMIVSIFLIAFVVRLPNFCDFRFVSVNYQPSNGTSSSGAFNNITIVKTTIEWQHNIYNNAVFSYIVSGTFVGLLPLLCLLALNARLVVEIRRSTRYIRYHLAADSRIQSVISHEEKKITLMLIFIIVIFFICQSPYIIWVIITAVTNYDFTASAEFELFHDLALILLALKSACNFILYCWFSEKFWNTFKQVFCLRYCLPQQPLNRNGRGSRGQQNHHRPSCFITRETTC